MNVESYLLRALFVACMVVCFGTLGSMLFARGTHATASLAQAPLDQPATHACLVDAEDAPCTRMD